MIACLPWAQVNHLLGEHYQGACREVGGVMDECKELIEL